MREKGFQRLQLSAPRLDQAAHHQARLAYQLCGKLLNKRLSSISEEDVM